MKRGGRYGSQAEHPGQLQIEWNTGGVPVAATAPLPAPAVVTNKGGAPDAAKPKLVERPPWDFRTTFPPPTQEAIDAGLISYEDAEPENVQELHDEHAREQLTVLHDIDALLVARYRGVDPSTGKPPRTEATRKKLEKFFANEVPRLNRWFQALMDTYEEVFGTEASVAFGKTLAAWHADNQGTPELGAEKPPTGLAIPAGEPSTATSKDVSPSAEVPRLPRAEGHAERRRVVARLPVPKPLPAAIAAGSFGEDEDGHVHPGPAEVRAITERHAEKLIDLLKSIGQASGSCVPGEDNRLRGLFDSALAAYAEDFGQHAAEQLEAYVRRQASLDASDKDNRGRRR